MFLMISQSIEKDLSFENIYKLIVNYSTFYTNCQSMINNIELLIEISWKTFLWIKHIKIELLISDVFISKKMSPCNEMTVQMGKNSFALKDIGLDVQMFHFV